MIKLAMGELFRYGKPLWNIACILVVLVEFF